jgi:Fe-S cluster assembly scaffold protein SufB
VSSTSYNSILKQKNLWPSVKEENWKYFDFKNFESLTKDSVFKTGIPKINFIDKTNSDLGFSGYEIIVKPSEFIVPAVLKGKIQFELINNAEALNAESKIDFRLTNLNLKGFGLKINIKDQKDLNLQITYLSDINDESVNSFLFFNISNSKVSILEKDKARFGSYFSVHTQAKLVNSNLEHIVLFANSGVLSDHFSDPDRGIISQAKIYNLEVLAEEGSEYKNTSVFLKNKFLRAQQSLCLNALKSVGQLNAFSISDENNFSELRTEVLHLQPKTQSRQLFKTIAADESKSVFNGRVFVDSIAQKTDAAQLCQGILLHAKAEINAKPELEIYADDVKAAHGAAIGQLGRDQIFYLISRGIKPELAYKMLSKAFAGEVIASIENMDLRTLCQKTIEESASGVFEKLAESFQ